MRFVLELSFLCVLYTFNEINARRQSSDPHATDEFDCSERSDGNYEDPSNPCSQVYFNCYRGKATEFTCQKDFAYDAISDKCLYLKYVLWCGRKNTKRPSRFRPGPPPSKKSLFCRGKPDGKYADPREKCARHFFVCVEETEWKQSCAGGTYFDEWSGDCLFRRFVFACGGQPTPLAPFSTQSPNMALFRFDCAEKRDGDYENPTEHCSDSFVSCSDQNAIFKKCQKGLVFDSISNSCQEPQYVEWCGGTATKLSLSTTPPMIPPFKFDCWGKLDGNYEDPINPCSSNYVTCVAYNPVFRKCPGHLKFDVKTGTCLLAPYVEWCGGEPTTTEKFQTRPVPLNPGIEFDCIGKLDGDYGNPEEKCSQFYFSCSGGEMSFRHCSDETKFDVISGHCLKPRYVKWCGGYSTTTVKPTPTPSRTPPFKFDCSYQKDGNYDSPIDPCSSVYVTCSGGETIFVHCPDLLIYDWDSNRCIEEEYVAGCGGKPTTPEMDLETRAPSSFDCSGLEDGYYENPVTSCSESYYACVGEISEEVWCPLKTSYDKYSGECVLPEFVDGCDGTATKTFLETERSPAPPGSLSSPECEERGPGKFPAESGCTQKYYTCVEGGVRRDGLCGTDTYFESEWQICVYKSQVEACLEGGKPLLPPGPRVPKPTPFTKGEAVIDCSQKKNGMYGRNCEKNFFLCSERIAYPLSCTDNKVFAGSNGMGGCIEKQYCSTLL